MTNESRKRKRSNKNNKKNKLKKHTDISKATEIVMEDDDTRHKHVEDTQGSSIFQDEVESKIESEDIHNFDDSHDEDQPKKKKKKKEARLPETTNSKGKKSIRQMKREKFAKKQAEEKAAAKDTMKSDCLSYLSQWKHNRQNWKFMKIKQVWLNKNKFSSQLVPESSWPILLEYFESAKGNIRNLLLEDANKVIQQMDEWTESQVNTSATSGKTNEDPDKLNKPDETSYKRARDLLQFLAE